MVNPQQGSCKIKVPQSDCRDRIEFEDFVGTYMYTYKDYLCILYCKWVSLNTKFGKDCCPSYDLSTLADTDSDTHSKPNGYGVLCRNFHTAWSQIQITGMGSESVSGNIIKPLPFTLPHFISFLSFGRSCGLR